MWYFADYISVDVLYIKHLALEDTKGFRRTFRKLGFAFKVGIHKMGNRKMTVFVVSGVMNILLLILSVLGIRDNTKLN